MLENNSYSDSQLKDLILVDSIAGCVGVLMATIIFIVLLCGKVYKTVLQRLFMYTLLAILIHDLTHAANIEHHFNYTPNDEVCMYVGFISVWGSWTIYSFYMFIILYLLIAICIQIKGDICRIFLKSKYLKVFLELMTILVSVVLPLSILWIPFKQYTEYRYGFSDGYCWLISNESFSLKSQVYFGGFILYEAVGLVAICVIVGIMIVYSTLSTVFQRAKDLLRRIVILLAAIIAYLVLINALLVLMSDHRAGYSMKIFAAISTTLIDYVPLCGYLITFHYSKSCHVIKRLVTRKKRRVLGHMHKNCTEYGTFKESERVTAPSNTFYDSHIEYTGGFTIITD